MPKTTSQIATIAPIKIPQKHFNTISSYTLNDYLNYIGRIAFPIFAFQISEGFVHTKNIKKYFKVPTGINHAVDDVSFSIEKGETLGVVGASG